MKHFLGQCTTDVPVIRDDTFNNIMFKSDDFSKHHTQIDKRGKMVSAAINNSMKHSKFMDSGVKIQWYLTPPNQNDNNHHHLMHSFFYDDKNIKQKNVFDVTELRTALTKLIRESEPIMSMAVELKEKGIPPTLSRNYEDLENGIIKYSDENVREFCESLISSNLLSAPCDIKLSISENDKPCTIRLYGQKKGQEKPKCLPTNIQGTVHRVCFGQHLIWLKRNTEQGHPIAKLTFEEKFLTAIKLSAVGNYWMEAKISQMHHGSEHAIKTIEYELKELTIKSIGIKITAENKTDPVNLKKALQIIINLLDNK